MIELDDKWTKQPQRPLPLARGPLTRNLEIFLPWVGGTLRDYASGGVCTPSGSGTIVPDAQLGYVRRNVRSSTLETSVQYTKTTSNAPITVAIWLKPANNDTSLDASIRLGYSLTSGDQLIVYNNVVSGGDVYVGTNGNDFYTSGGVAPTGAWTSVVFSFDGSGNLSTSNCWVMVNGVVRSITQAGSTRALDLYDGQTVTIGGETTSGREYRGDIGPVAVWSRALSQGEAQFWHRNPWQLFSKKPKRVYVTAGASGDVTVALSGQAATASAGTLVPSSTVALSGQAATISAGTLTPTFPRALSGTAVTVSAGTLTPSSTVPLVGQAVTVSAGTITYNAGSDITLALSGQAVAASAGTLTLSSTVPLSGSAATASAGTLVPTFPRALSGTAVTVSAGTVTQSASVPLVGQAVTVSAGTLTYAAIGDVTVALTGSEVTVSAGTLTASGGGGGADYGSDKKKRRFVTKVGGKLVVFNDATKALNALERDDPAEEVAEQPKPAPKPQKTKPDQTVSIADIKATAAQYAEQARANALLRQQEYEQALALYERLKQQQDDEEVEMLLMAL